MEVINTVANVLFPCSSGRHILSDKEKKRLHELALTFDESDKTRHAENALRRPRPEDMAAYAQLATRFKQPKSRHSQGAVQPSLHACRVIMFSGNAPDKPVTHNRVMRRMIDMLLLAYPSPTKRSSDGKQQSSAMQVAAAYGCIRRSLEDTPGDLKTLIPLLPCGPMRIAGYRRKQEDATTRRIMRQGLVLPPQYPVSPAKFPSPRQAAATLPPFKGDDILTTTDPENRAGMIAYTRRNLFHSPARPSTSTGGSTERPVDSPARPSTSTGGSTE